jgi:hypothetical protein
MNTEAVTNPDNDPMYLSLVNFVNTELTDIRQVLGLYNYVNNKCYLVDANCSDANTEDMDYIPSTVKRVIDNIMNNREPDITPDDFKYNILKILSQKLDESGYEEFVIQQGGKRRQKRTKKSKKAKKTRKSRKHKKTRKHRKSRKH